MGIRPAHTFREVNKVAWARYSKRKPRKSYVKSMPHNALVHFNMGVDKPDYEVQADLVNKDPIQLRDNALEAARQAVNKYLEKRIPNNYSFKIRVFPHNVIRENKMIAGAGADRLQSGMAHPYGRPSERAARIKNSRPVLTVKCMEKDLPHVRGAYRLAKIKLSGKFDLKIKKLKK